MEGNFPGPDLEPFGRPNSPIGPQVTTAVVGRDRAEKRFQGAGAQDDRKAVRPNAILYRARVFFF